MDRRKFIQTSALTGVALTTGLPLTYAKENTAHQQGKSPWPICLNASTIRPASLEEKINVASKAGYDALEPWIGDLEKYEKEGGDLKELGGKIKDKGLFIPNIIGLWDCMPMDDQDFKASLTATRERMRMSAAIGSKHVAAIPVPDREDFDVETGIRRYRELLKIGRDEYGIIVAFEFVGFFKGIHRFGEAAGIAIDANDKDACLIMDTFHLYRGGSGFNSIKHINPDFIADFHFNDVPSTTPRNELGDKDRIYPGDGILPLVQLLKDLDSINYRGPLSLELFNREHWKQNPLDVASTGLKKIMDLIVKAGV
ncbi:MAG: sugar phosphate isomerase/epimerase [Ignavibacteriae bacterium]|nr:sugar phosphate isomerase/epimerase [Ignavibacteriota bacterium]